jgi:hypothetical protein
MVAMVAAGKATADEMKTLMPATYPIDDITKKAAELYSFILKKD